jgi:hypothetical protein
MPFVYAKDRLVLYGRWRPEFPDPKWGWQRDPEEQSYDLGLYRNQLCTMCRKERIRYVHVMVHDDWHEKHYVGFQCAGHMIGTHNMPNWDLVNTWNRELDRAARRRNRDMVAEARATLEQQWHCGTNAMERLRAIGYRATVFWTSGEPTLRLQGPNGRHTFEPHRTWQGAKRRAEGVMAAAIVREMLRQKSGLPRSAREEDASDGSV